jgi:hypothetical protein
MGNIQGTQFEEIFACCDPRNGSCDPSCEPRRKENAPPESIIADPVIKGQQEVGNPLLPLTLAMPF